MVRLAALLLLAAATAAHAQGAAGTTRTATVTITATPGRLAVAESIPAGPVTFVLQNRAGVAVSAQLLAVRRDHTPAEAAQILATGAPLPEWISAAGGVGAVAAGGVASVTHSLPPGGYVVASTVPDSAGTPQYRRGYVAPLRAAGQGGFATVPGVSLVIAAGSSSFRATPVSETDGRRIELVGRQRGRPLQHGELVIEIETTGRTAHEIALVRMDSTAMLRQYVQWFSGGQRGRAPGRPVGGVGVLPPSQRVWLRVRLEQGTYWFYCNAIHQAGRRGYEVGEYAQIAVR